MVTHKCVIVIPVHSNNPSQFELISFEQCFKILCKYPIKVIAPKGIDLTKYKAVVNTFDVIYIDPKWQSSLLMYNKLKLSRFFYNLFKEFDYLLTYELDAFVFSDELDFWCSKGYDYIGAPWFEDYHLAKQDSKIIGVGNSGFSLRKISTLQKVLKSIYYQDPKEIGKRSTRPLAYLLYPFRWLMNKFGNENYTIQHAYNWYEDMFICHILPKFFPDFKIATPSDAGKFSLECNAENLYKINNNTLPFGCHAWWRYELDFWTPHIERFGYTLSSIKKNEQ